MSFHIYMSLNPLIIAKMVNRLQVPVSWIPIGGRCFRATVVSQWRVSGGIAGAGVLLFTTCMRPLMTKKFRKKEWYSFKSFVLLTTAWLSMASWKVVDSCLTQCLGEIICIIDKSTFLCVTYFMSHKTDLFFLCIIDLLQESRFCSRCRIKRTAIEWLGRSTGSERFLDETSRKSASQIISLEGSL